MAHWLMKSEPENFGIDHLVESGEPMMWKGVRNYQVRNTIRDDMKVGDLAFFYHSNAKPSGVVGVIRIATDAYTDPRQFDPKSPKYDEKATKDNPIWVTRDVELVEKLPRTVALSELKEADGLEDMIVTRRGNRLSITPVTDEEWEIVMRLAKN